MRVPTFAAGAIAGAVVSLGAVVAFPGLVPERPAARQTAPRAEVVRDVVVREVVRGASRPRPKVDRQPEGTGENDEKAIPALEALPETRHTARHAANETAAIAVLRNVISAQSQFQSTARADENNNGVGEYGSFGELSGHLGVRDGTKLFPPVMSSAFRRIEGGRVARSGYYYRIYLRRAGGGWIAERDAGGFGAHEVDAKATETTWCAYAWPITRGKTGTRTFFVNQQGDILANEKSEYGGDREPGATAALDAEGQAAIDNRGGDGADWKQAG